ncbi:DUF1467 family protein [Roseibium sp.]|uniref:DUF1467 family protein n=1 Tax=Roseibium sp. TaxID=1936156 RepID=UPI003A970709
MTVTFSIAVYFMIWWIILFAILPFGRVRSQEEAGAVVPGSEASAPERPRFLRVIILTTIVATAIFGGFYLLRTSGFSLDDIPFLKPPSAR